MGYKLRDYQQECVDTVKKLPDGARSVVVMATGLGKTFTAANFDFHGRVLWVSHRDELVRQPEKFFRMRDMTFGIEKAGEVSDGEDVVSASIQSICKDKRLGKFSKDEFDTIIVDEAQHAAAPTYRKVLSYFNPRHLIGLTATPQRGDKIRLTDVFDDICFKRDLKWGIEHGYLSRVRCVRVKADFDMERLNLYLGDYSASDLDESMQISNNDIVVTKAYLDYSVPNRWQTLVYCPKVSTCRRVEATIRKALPESERDTVQVVWDGMSVDERRAVLDGYRQKKVRCIINCMILTEGVDLPDTRVVIVDRPTTNSGLYTQIVGRGTRLADGKSYCLVVDVVGKNYLKREICTAPTLFGVDPATLPEQIRAKMEKTDLLEISETIINEQAKQAKGAALLREMVDIFTQESISIIEENAPKGYKAVAEAYNEKLARGTNLGKAFDDIVVKDTPSMRRRYKIEPSFTGAIYLSEPDMLGKTIVDIDVPEAQFGIPEIRCTSGPMPVDEASSMIHDILRYIFPEWTRVKWSKTGRDAQSRLNATDKQVLRIQKEYAKDKIAAAEDDPAMNRREASDLIDLKNEIGSLKEQEEKYRIMEEEACRKEKDRRKPDRPKKSPAKPLLQLSSDIVGENDEEREKKWEDTMSVLFKIIEEKKAEEKAEQEKILKEAGGGKQFQVTCTADFSSCKGPASSKQLSFVQGLLYKAAKRQIYADCDIYSKLPEYDMWRTGMIIDYLKTALDSIPDQSYVQAVLKTGDFLKQIKKMRPEECPKKISCDYSQKQPG